MAMLDSSVFIQTNMRTAVCVSRQIPESDLTVPHVTGAECWGHCLAHRPPMHVSVTGEHAFASQELNSQEQRSKSDIVHHTSTVSIASAY